MKSFYRIREEKDRASAVKIFISLLTSKAFIGYKFTDA